jgi:hypothetical protein
VELPAQEAWPSRHAERACADEAQWAHIRQICVQHAAGDKTVYFDVTRFAGEIYKKRTKSLGQLMDEMGIK